MRRDLSTLRGRDLLSIPFASPGLRLEPQASAAQNTLSARKPRTRVFILVIVNVIARIDTLSGQKPPPRQTGHPKFETPSFVLESDNVPKLGNSSQFAYGRSREQPTHNFRKDLHELPQMILVHVTMEQMPVGWCTAYFRVPGIGIEGRPIWIDHEEPMETISSVMQQGLTTEPTHRFSFSNTSTTLSSFSFNCTNSANRSSSILLHSALFLQNLNLDLFVTTFSQPSRATSVSSATSNKSSQHSLNNRWNLSVLQIPAGCANFFSKPAYRIASYRPTAG